MFAYLFYKIFTANINYAMPCRKQAVSIANRPQCLVKLRIYLPRKHAYKHTHAYTHVHIHTASSDIRYPSSKQGSTIIVYQISQGRPPHAEGTLCSRVWRAFGRGVGGVSRTSRASSSSIHLLPVLLVGYFQKTLPSEAWMVLKFNLPRVQLF